MLWFYSFTIFRQVAKEICASDGSHGNHKCKDTYGSYKFHHTVSCCPIM